MQLILVFFFFWDELVKDTIIREQTRQKLGKLQKLETVNPWLKKQQRLLNLKPYPKETRSLQINTTETQVKTDYRNFHTKTKHLLNISNTQIFGITKKFIAESIVQKRYLEFGSTFLSTSNILLSSSQNLLFRPH